MENLKYLTDEALHQATARAVKFERAALINVLAHLREIERRRAYDKLPSLFAYACQRLGYSADEAQRRKLALRMLREFPQIEPAIASGKLNLTHLVLANSIFKSEKKADRAFTPEKKIELLRAIAGRSTRAAEKIILTFAPEAPPKPDRIRPCAKGVNRVEADLTDATLEKLEKIRGLLAHKHPDLTFGELVDCMADIAIEQLNPARQPKRAQKESKAEIRRQVWARDQHQCTECESTYAVEEDHRLPESMGGEYTLENMRLLCRTCNQRAAIEKLGQSKMEPYLTPPQVRERTVSYETAAPRFFRRARGANRLVLVPRTSFYGEGHSKVRPS